MAMAPETTLILPKHLAVICRLTNAFRDDVQQSLAADALLQCLSCALSERAAEARRWTPSSISNSLMSSTRKRVAIIVVILAVGLLFPFKKTLVPEQRVLVVTKEMRPIRNAMVRQSWQDYSLERYGHEEDRPTDENGRITFPTRTIRASLLWRVIGPLASIAGQGVHASFGVHTNMSASPNYGTASTEVVRPQPGEIVYRLEL